MRVQLQLWLFFHYIFGASAFTRESKITCLSIFAPVRGIAFAQLFCSNKTNKQIWKSYVNLNPRAYSLNIHSLRLTLLFTSFTSSICLKASRYVRVCFYRAFVQMVIYRIGGTCTSRYQFKLVHCISRDKKGIFYSQFIKIRTHCR